MREHLRKVRGKTIKVRAHKRGGKLLAGAILVAALVGAALAVRAQDESEAEPRPSPSPASATPTG